MLVMVRNHPQRRTVQLGVGGARGRAEVALRPREVLGLVGELLLGLARAVVR